MLEIIIKDITKKNVEESLKNKNKQIITVIKKVLFTLKQYLNIYK